MEHPYSSIAEVIMLVLDGDSVDRITINSGAAALLKDR